jgi:hypothetical protein
VAILTPTWSIGADRDTGRLKLDDVMIEVTATSTSTSSKMGVTANPRRCSSVFHAFSNLW